MIQNKLDEFGMNTSELERRAGLSASSVRRILVGSIDNPTVETLSAIAEVFDCSIDELVGQRVRAKGSSHDLLQISKLLPWNGKLFVDVTNATCDYLDNIKMELTLEQNLKAIIEIYKYCIIQKEGKFDNSFHQWYMQKLKEDIF